MYHMSGPIKGSLTPNGWNTILRWYKRPVWVAINVETPACKILYEYFPMLWTIGHSKGEHKGEPPDTLYSLFMCSWHTANGDSPPQFLSTWVKVRGPWHRLRSCVTGQPLIWRGAWQTGAGHHRTHLDSSKWLSVSQDPLTTAVPPAACHGD